MMSDKMCNFIIYFYGKLVILDIFRFFQLFNGFMLNNKCDDTVAYSISIFRHCFVFEIRHLYTTSKQIN